MLGNRKPRKPTHWDVILGRHPGEQARWEAVLKSHYGRPYWKGTLGQALEKFFNVDLQWELEPLVDSLWCIFLVELSSCILHEGTLV